MRSRLGFSMDVISSSPHLPKRLGWNRRQSAIFGPCAHGIERRSFETDGVDHTHRHAAKPSEKPEPARTGHHPAEEFHPEALPCRMRACADRIPPIVQQVMMQIDVYRANVG